MVKKLFLAMMMVLTTATTVHGAKPDQFEPGGFYIDDVKFTNYDEGPHFEVEVPFKAWFSFPASFCLLRITMPQSIDIYYYDEETGHYIEYQPGEDFTIDWINVNGNLVQRKWELAWGSSETPVVNEHGEELNAYNMVIYNTAKEGAVWDPVSWAFSNDHYKMFSLYFRYNGDEEFSGKIGDIEITSYMVNYANVVPWCPYYNVGVDSHGREYRYLARTFEDERGYKHPCGDSNGDDEVTISDIYFLIDALLKDNYDIWNGDGKKDVNEDGSVNIIDLEMTQEAIFEYYDEGWWYTGHTIEVGHSKATAKLKRGGQILIGDVNGDGIIDIGDVVDLNNVILVGQPNNNNEDIDGDGQVDVSDVVCLISIILYGRTEMPQIDVEYHSYYYLITATGNGEVLLYIDGEPVNNPYYLYFGNEEQQVHITATAREGQKAISETTSRDLYVPANW